ncbi:hypothetical protein KSS87_017547 [Heliosperma pusillum]|nr:hypothetical protein KSS87_017547 [Heliosperma pusillum]
MHKGFSDNLSAVQAFGDKSLEREKDSRKTGTSRKRGEGYVALTFYFGGVDFTAEEILKYQKYEADYACRLRAKYFSNKDIYGADVFDLKVDMGNETIKASRWSPTQSFADPAQSFEDTGRVVASGSEIPPNDSNGNVAPQNKNS